MTKEPELIQGIKYYTNESYEEALNIFNKFDTQTSLFYSGLIYSEKRELKKAIKYLEKCLKKAKKEDNDIIKIVEELVSTCWQGYLCSQNKSQKEFFKKSFKKRLKELEHDCLNHNFWKFLALSLEEENREEALKMWKNAYHFSRSHKMLLNMDESTNTTFFSPDIGINTNKLTERLSALKIMEFSKDKEEALDYLFSYYNLSAKYESKKKFTGTSLENIVIKEKERFLKIYNKKLHPEIKKIEDVFLKTGNLNDLIGQIKSSPNYSKNIELQFALSLSYTFKGKGSLACKIIESPLYNILKQKNKKMIDVTIKSKSEVKKYSYIFDNFRIFPKIKIIFKKDIGQETNIINHFKREDHKKNLALNLPHILASLNDNQDKWIIMRPPIEQDPLIYLRQCSDKKRFEILSEMIEYIAKIHAHAPSYDSGLISLIHSPSYLKNKQFYVDQIKNKFFGNLREIIKPYNQKINQQISSLVVDKDKIKKESDILNISYRIKYCNDVLKKLDDGELNIQNKNDPLFLFIPSRGVRVFPAYGSKREIENSIKMLYKKEKKKMIKLLEEQIKKHTSFEEQRIKKLKKGLRMNQIKINDLEQKFFKYYCPVLDIISSCSQGIYKDAFLRNFLILEAFGDTGVSLIDFGTFSNLPYQMDLVTLLEGELISIECENKYKKRNLLEIYIAEFNNQISKHDLKINKIKDFKKFEKDYHACAIQRNLSLFGSFFQINEKPSYLVNCLAKSKVNIDSLLKYINKKTDRKKLENLSSELTNLQERLFIFNTYVDESSMRIEFNSEYR